MSTDSNDPVDSVDPVDPAASADAPIDEADRRGAVRRRGRRGALLEFYEEVGRRLGLPGRRSRVVVPPARRSSSVIAHASGAPASAGKRAPAWLVHTRRWLPVSAVLILLAAGASFLEWPWKSGTIPVSFRGTWVSAHAGYEGRRLVLTDSTVQVIINGQSTASPAAVRSASVRSTYLGPALHLVIATADGPDTLEMTLLTPSKLTLRRPADVVWDRVVNQRTSPTAAPLPSPKASR